MEKEPSAHKWGEGKKWVGGLVDEEVHAAFKAFCAAHRQPIYAVLGGLIEECLERHGVVVPGIDNGPRELGEGRA